MTSLAQAMPAKCGAESGSQPGTRTAVCFLLRSCLAPTEKAAAPRSDACSCSQR